MEKMEKNKMEIGKPKTSEKIVETDKNAEINDLKLQLSTAYRMYAGASEEQARLRKQMENIWTTFDIKDRGVGIFTSEKDNERAIENARSRSEKYLDKANELEKEQKEERGEE